jgi:hypothetical protein
VIAISLEEIKRVVFGTHHSVSEAHLMRYLGIMAQTPPANRPARS